MKLKRNSGITTLNFNLLLTRSEDRNVREKVKGKVKKMSQT